MNFTEKYGFERTQVNLGNWRVKPFSDWSFQHVHEIIPSALIKSDHHEQDKAERSSVSFNNTNVKFHNEIVSIETFLKQSHTNQFMVSRYGQTLFDWCADSADPQLPHIVFSVSKSISGLLAGILQDRNILDVSKPIGFFLPEMKNSAYEDCPLQHLLDMRVSLDFVEEYLNADGDYARYRRATGWNPQLSVGNEPGMQEFLQSLNKGPAEHGGKFDYRSPNSDLLGLLLERVSGQSFAELMSGLLWHPLQAHYDAFITVDKFGAPRSAGGISVVATDLLKLGELICQNGEINGKNIISEHWLNDMRKNGDQAAWAAGDFAGFMPGARYRNQWYQAGNSNGVVLAIGIHGQWIYCDTKNNVVIIKLSSQPVPQDDQLDVQCLSVFGQLVEWLG